MSVRLTKCNPTKLISWIRCIQPTLLFIYSHRSVAAVARKIDSLSGDGMVARTDFLGVPVITQEHYWWMIQFIVDIKFQAVHPTLS